MTKASILAALVLAITLSACGGTKVQKADTQAKQALSGQQAKANEAQAQQLLSKCVSTSHSKNSLINCLSQGRNKAVLKDCIAKENVQVSALLRKSSRIVAERKMEGCLL